MFWKKKSKAELPEPPPHTAPQERPAEVTAQVDACREELLRATDASEPTRDAELAFWKAVLAAPGLSLIGMMNDQATEAIKAGGMPPLLQLRGSHDGPATIPVYTRDDLAAKAGVHWNNEQDTFTTLHLPMPGALGTICSMAERGARVLIDEVPGEVRGYGTDVDALPGLYSYFHGTPPLGCLDAMSRAIVAGGRHQNAYRDAYKVLATAERVFFLKTGDGKPVCLEGADGPVLGLWIHEEHATGLAQQQSGDVQVASFAASKLHELNEQAALAVGPSFVGLLVNPTSSPLPVIPRLYAEAIAGT